MKTNSHHPAAVIGDGILVVIRLQVKLLGTDRREAEDDTQDLLNNVEISVSWNFIVHSPSHLHAQTHTHVHTQIPSSYISTSSS